VSERNWTSAQLFAITAREKNMILSAAAGSGKTATLTERIIRLIKDPENGADISRMLVVTFTVAAAGELKTRIADALNRAIADDPGNMHLTRQLAALEGARISTIDSFFKSELAPHFSALGLPPDFGILDTAEAEVLRREAMEETVVSFFENGQCDSSAGELFACLSTARNETDLTEALLKTASDLRSYDITPESLRMRAESLEMGADDFFKTPYADTLKDAMRKMSAHYSVRFDMLAGELEGDRDTKKYVPEARSLSTLSRDISDLCEKTCKDACSFFSGITFGRLSPIKRGKTSEAYDRFKVIRAEFKDEINALSEGFFKDPDSYSGAMKKTGANICALSRVYERFLSVFAAKKRERGGCDFSDLAEFARRIFTNPDGTPTAAARETGKKFDYIFIDEYQDTNSVQDAVFNAVSESAGRFMVGDVKQSIYGFRGSCPQLFCDYREKYEKGDDGCAVFMSENFRSDRCVIDLSNTVSRYIFKTGKTPFEPCDELVASKPTADSEGACEIILVERETEDGDDAPSEAQCVASRISELLSGERLSDGTAVRPKDIAILLRSGAAAEEYVRALSDLGIPVTNSASEEFFDNGEVLLVLCLLNTADNPLRDIYLAGAMKSPLFGFTLSDLVCIRKSTRVPLWYSLCEYCEGGEDEALRARCIEFKRTVDRWRALSCELYCDEMLRLIISDTSLYTYGGDGVRKNSDIVRSLKLLTDHAATVAKRGGMLCELISHLNSLIEKKEKPISSADPNSVTILTIHRSKGLEWPVCFLCETSKRFNTRDSSEKLLIDRSGLVAMKLYDKDGIVRCDNPLRRALAMRINDASSDEEARVLYVAMTRARERLIVSCKVKSSAGERLQEAAENAEFPLDSYEVMTCNTYGDWIINALARYGDGSFYIYKKGTDIKGGTRVTASDVREENKELLEIFEKALDFSYDKEYLWNIPAKLSVSVLKPDLLGGDEEREYFDAPATVKMPKEAPVPAFLSETKDANGAQKGTATHIFMQFCSYEGLRKNGPRAELERLVEKRFISRENADLVRLDEIELFVKSELFSELEGAQQIMRERRFNTLLPAADFTADGTLREKLLKDGTAITVQGVVDCIFITREGKAVLVDYKTDRLTPGELADEALAREKLLSRHSRQLELYRAVCERMLGRPFDRVCIYSLPLGRTVEVK